MVAVAASATGCAGRIGVTREGCTVVRAQVCLQGSDLSGTLNVGGTTPLAPGDCAGVAGAAPGTVRTQYDGVYPATGEPVRLRRTVPMRAGRVTQVTAGRDGLRVELRRCQ